MYRNCRKLMMGLVLGGMLWLGSGLNRAQAQTYDPPALVRAMSVPARVYYRALPPWMWYNPYYSPGYPMYPYPYPVSSAANPAYVGGAAPSAGSLPSLPPLPPVPPLPPIPPVPGSLR